MMERRKKIRIIYYIIIALLPISYLVYLISGINKSKDTLTLTHDYPSSYLTLINTKDTSEMQPVINYVTKFRFPISLIDYQTKYTLIIYKISDSSENISLAKDIVLNKDHSNEKTNKVYMGVNENNFELFYHSLDREMAFSRLSLNLSGDSIVQLVNSDTLVSYYLLFDQISWKRIPEKNLDVYIEPKDATPLAKTIPASIAFLKRNGSIYFIMLSVNDLRTSIDKNILQNLLSQN